MEAIEAITESRARHRLFPATMGLGGRRERPGVLHSRELRGLDGGEGGGVRECERLRCWRVCLMSLRRLWAILRKRRGGTDRPGTALAG